VKLKGAVRADTLKRSVAPQELQDYKTVMGGYYKIATEGPAVPDYVVDNVYNVIK